jgi:type III secretion protein J
VTHLSGRRAMKGGLLLCVFLFMSACKTLLHSGLDEREANNIIRLLDSEGISAAKEIDTRTQLATLMVDEADLSRAIGILESHGLPSKKYATIDQVFTGDGLVSSPVEERARLHYAINQELSRTISELDGVLSARVHVVMPEEPDLVGLTDASEMQATASVLIRRRSDMPLENLVPNLKQFVSSSIQYLEYENVAVIDFVVPVGETDVPTANVARAEGTQVDYLPYLFIFAGLLVLGAAGSAVYFLTSLRAGISRLLKRTSGASSDSPDPSGEDDAPSIPARKIVSLSGGDR